MDVTTNPISKHGSMNQLAGATRAPASWRGERGELQPDIGDTTEEAVSLMKLLLSQLRKLKMLRILKILENQ